jgi:hypothetical protein
LGGSPEIVRIAGKGTGNRHLLSNRPPVIANVRILVAPLRAHGRALAVASWRQYWCTLFGAIIVVALMVARDHRSCAAGDRAEGQC